jgi:hypothetical protein
MIKRHETDVAAPVVKWLQDLHFDVYQEVSMGYGSRRADIIAVMKPIIWIVEVKTSFSLQVLEQAWKWTRMAHRVSVAVPWSKKPQFYDYLCKLMGIGLFEVEYNGMVNCRVDPPLHRRVASGLILKRIHEAQRTFAPAGNADGCFYTPFRGTVLELVQFVTSHPGCSLKEAINGIKHHYRTNATALSCVSKYIENGVIKEIRMEQDGRLRRLYVKTG